MYDYTHYDGLLMPDDSGNLSPLDPPVFNPEGGGGGYIKLPDYQDGSPFVDPGPMPPVKMPAQEDVVQVVIPQPETDKKSNMLLLIGAGVALYFLFGKK